MVLPTAFFVSTALSVIPFEAGWYGGENKCIMPFLFIKLAISTLAKLVTLSDTNVSGNPCVMNISTCYDLVFAVVVEPICFTSNHFECASTSIRNICPLNGPANVYSLPMYTLCQSFRFLAKDCILLVLCFGYLDNWNNFVLWILYRHPLRATNSSSGVTLSLLSYQYVLRVISVILCVAMT